MTRLQTRARRTRRRLGLSLVTLGSLVILIAGGLLVASRLPAHSAYADGTVPFVDSLYAWGQNTSGELGTGTTNPQNKPASVSLPTGVSAAAIAAGTNHTVALGSDGKVYAWGDNSAAQLGSNASGASSSTPVVVPFASLPSGVTITQVAAGGNFSLALASDGTVWAWGDNTSGQLGITASPSPVAAPNKVNFGSAATIKAIAAGNAFVVALDSNGAVYTWGDNASGQLGRSTSASSDSTPVQLVCATTCPQAKAVAAGDTFATLLTTDGQVLAWGSNMYGQLGNGTTTDSISPVMVDFSAYVDSTTHIAPNMVAIADGASHSMALDASGNVYSWGYNAAGQVGNGNSDSDYNGENDCTTISAGDSESTGDLAAMTVMQPYKVQIGSSVLAARITAGACTSYAISTDGAIYAWGDNTFGEVGVGSVANQLQLTPALVTMPDSNTDALAIAAGGNHAAFIGAEMGGTALPGTTTVLGGATSTGQTWSLTIPPDAVTTDPTLFAANEIDPNTLPPLPNGYSYVTPPISFQATDLTTGSLVDTFPTNDLTLSFTIPGGTSYTGAGGNTAYMARMLTALFFNSMLKSSGGTTTIASTNGTTWTTSPTTTTTSGSGITVDASIGHWSAWAVIQQNSFSGTGLSGAGAPASAPSNTLHAASAAPAGSDAVAPKSANVAAPAQPSAARSASTRAASAPTTPLPLSLVELLGTVGLLIVVAGVVLLAASRARRWQAG